MSGAATEAAEAAEEGRRATARNARRAWVALLAMAAVSYGASWVHWGSAAVGLVIALAIALAKVAVVALWFMELVDERFTSRVVLVVAAGFVVLLAGLMVVDVAMRAG